MRTTTTTRRPPPFVVVVGLPAALLTVAVTRVAGVAPPLVLAAGLSLAVLVRTTRGRPRAMRYGCLAIAAGTVQAGWRPPATSLPHTVWWPLFVLLGVALTAAIGAAIGQSVAVVRAEGGRAPRLRAALDTWLVTASVLAVALALARHCAAGEHRHQPAPTTWVVVGWLCVDIVWVCLTPTWYGRPMRGRRGPVVLVAAAAAAAVGVDVWGNLPTTGTDRLSLATRVLGVLMIASGPFTRARPGSASGPTTRRRAATGVLTRCVPVLACAVVVSVHLLAGHGSDACTTILAGSVAVALWTRQCLARVHNLHLAEQLARRPAHIPRQATRGIS
ncbi:hypothetical protein [Embleya sp. AB8]|uniref:hypothetical protein n=1 Tax=Embleya sp. AB8 TaxID=3156304 RepID=UPI003C7157DF